MSDQNKIKLYTTLGIISSLIALGLFPLIFAILGLISGSLIIKAGNEKRGNRIKILAVCCGIVGYLLGIIVNIS